MKDQASAPRRLGEIGLNNFPPYLMNRIMGRYNASLREDMAHQGMSTPKMRSLAVLSVIDGILIRELAIYAVVEQSTLSRALDGLATDGLVRRETDREDSRATRVFITEQGRATFERHWPAMARTYDQMFQDIPQAEQQAFLATLHKILRNVRRNEF